MQLVTIRLCLAMGLGVLTGVASAQVTRRTETLLPTTTVGFVSVSNYDVLAERWKKIPLGQLVNDPVMKPFEDDLRAQLRKTWSNVRERLGLNLEDLKGVPGGEAAVAFIQPKKEAVATALVIDVAGRGDKAKALLAKARATLIKQGAKESRQAFGTAAVWVYDMPPRPQDQVAAPKDGGRPVTVVSRQTIYFLAGDWFGAADDLEVVREILARLAGTGQGDSLAGVAGFQMVMKRCETDAQGAVPEVRVFIEPLGYAKFTQITTPKDKRRKGKPIVDVLENQGFRGVQGVGAYLELAPDGFQILYRLAIYAPGPHKNSMKMLVFPNGEDFTPQTWVSRDIATYATAYVDLLAAFDNFAPMYDELFAEGEKGAWEDMLKSMELDPEGPQINLRKELIKNLGNRVTRVTDYRLPITPASERSLYAIEAKDPEAVAKAIEKSVRNDPAVRKRVIGGQVIWEIIEEEEGNVPGIKLQAPSVTPKGATPKKKKDKDAADAKQGSFLSPGAAIAVAHGQLLLASHLDLLLKVLKPVPPGNMLRNNLVFKQTWATVDKLGLKTQCAREFSFTDEEYRPMYELIQQGKMPESESLLSRMINLLTGASEKGEVRQQRIKGGNLPDYQVVRRALGPSAMTVTSEPSGWFAKGILLSP